MYILFITSGYPTEKYRGNGIFEFDQAKALAKLGCKVVYAAIDVRSIRRWRKWGFERKCIDGIEIYGINIPLGKVPRWLLNRVYIRGLFAIYKRILREQGKPDILHSHFTDIGYTSSILKSYVNIPLVITEHSSLINRKIVEAALYQRASIAYKGADVVIAVSPALARRIEVNFQVQPLYVPNIVDTEIFKYSYNLDDNMFKIVSTGNLIRIKGMDLMIEAFAKAFADNRNVSLTIFGDGPERQRLEEIINKHNLSERVILRGMCSRTEIAHQLSQSQCFILASQTETFGVAYIEALSMGVPVIATKCGGPESFINGENGILVEVDNAKELTDALKYMYEHSNEYNREEISKQTKMMFSPEKVAKRLLKIYEELIYD